MSHLKILDSFLPIFTLSLWKYEGFVHLLGKKIDCVSSLFILRDGYVPSVLCKKRVARFEPGFAREHHIICFDIKHAIALRY